MIYSQRDPQWSGKKLGASGLTMGLFGCTTTVVAQALTLAGYGVTPGMLCDGLSATGGYTPGGLIIWAVVMRLYPQFHYGGAGYTFTQGRWGKFFHWCLQHDGKTYDPWYGADHFPPGYQQVSTTSAAIDPAPNQGGDDMALTEAQLADRYWDIGVRLWRNLNGKDPDKDSIRREANQAAHDNLVNGQTYAFNALMDKWFREAGYKNI